MSRVRDMQVKRLRRDGASERPTPSARGARNSEIRTKLAEAPTDAARIAVFLGLDRVFWEKLALADAVAQGLPRDSADHLRRALGGAAFSIVVPAAAHRCIRGSDGRLSREISQRAYDVAKVLAAVARLFGDDWGSTAIFVTSPHAMLHGRSPVEFAACGSAGADAVLDLLLRAEAGFAA